MNDAATSSAGLGLLARLTGVFFNPRPTYEAIVAHPTWFGAVMAAAVVAAICTGGFLLTEVGQQAWLDQMEASPGISNAPEEQRARQMEGMSKIVPFLGYIGAAQMLIIFPIVTLVFAGLIYFIFNVLMGGDATYKKVLAVVAAGSAVSIVQQVFVTPLNYVRESLSSPTNLSVFFPMLAEGSFVARLLGIIDLFMIWSLSLLAIGLSVLYRRTTSSAATVLFSLYGVIAVVIAGVLVWLNR